MNLIENLTSMRCEEALIQINLSVEQDALTNRLEASMQRVRIHDAALERLRNPVGEGVELKQPVVITRLDSPKPKRILITNDNVNDVQAGDIVVFDAVGSGGDKGRFYSGVEYKVKLNDGTDGSSPLGLHTADDWWFVDHATYGAELYKLIKE